VRYFCFLPFCLCLPNANKCISEWNRNRNSNCDCNPSPTATATPTPTPVVVTTPTPTLTHTYYVSTSGNDLSDGLTSSTPWKTLQHAEATATAPGSIIALKKGDVWSSAMALGITHGGTAGKSIVWDGAFGELVRKRKFLPAEVGLGTILR